MIRVNGLEYESIDEYLTSASWKLAGKQRHKYGEIKYWAHSDHQKDDGLWYTTGEAKAIQREIDKAFFTRKKHEDRKLREG